MKGLLIKDYYTLKAQYFNLKSLFILLFIYIMMIIFSDFNVAISYLSSISYIFILFIFRVDTMSGGFKYAKGLPITAKELVLSKYLLSAILAGILFLISFLSYLIAKPLGLAEDLNTFSSIMGVFMIALGFFVMNIIAMPLLFKFGARALFFVFIALVIASISLIKKYLPDFTSLSPALQVGLALISIIIIFAISYLISVKIVKKM